MQPESHSGAVTRPLSAISQLAMMGCPALRARGELAAGACAPVLGWDRGGSSSAGARAWWGACGTGARGPLRGVFGRLSFARLRESAFWGASAKYFRELTVECSLFVRQSLPPPVSLFPTCFTCSEKIDRAVLVLQACDGALFLVSRRDHLRRHGEDHGGRTVALATTLTVSTSTIYTLSVAYKVALFVRA